MASECTTLAHTHAESNRHRSIPSGTGIDSDCCMCRGRCNSRNNRHSPAPIRLRSRLPNACTELDHGSSPRACRRLHLDTTSPLPLRIALTCAFAKKAEIVLVFASNILPLHVTYSHLYYPVSSRSSYMNFIERDRESEINVAMAIPMYIYCSSKWCKYVGSYSYTFM